MKNSCFCNCNRTNFRFFAFKFLGAVLVFAETLSKMVSVGNTGSLKRNSSTENEPKVVAKKKKMRNESKYFQKSNIQPPVLVSEEGYSHCESLQPSVKKVKMSFTDDCSLEDFDNADAAEIDSGDVKSNLEENSTLDHSTFTPSLTPLHKYTSNGDGITDDTKSNTEKVERGSWITVGSLPAGWKFREVHSNPVVVDSNKVVESNKVVASTTGRQGASSVNKQQFILAPTGKIFPCRFLVHHSMIEN